MSDNARIQGKQKGHHRGSQVSGYRQLLMRAAITVLAATSLSVMTAGLTPAEDQPIPTITIGYQNGAITAIYEKTLDIDRRTYGLVPDVVMLDDHGRVLDPARLVVTAEVKFHVKKEQSNMIDKMIVTLPR
jgi:hypothetical protein